MSNLILREWNSQNIRQREDNYVCLTDMCKACGKLFADWYRQNSTKEYLEELSSVMGIPVTAENPQSQGAQALVEIYKGGTPELQGTWGHRKAALRLAQWLSPKFAIQVDTWVEELLTTGSVSLNSNIPQDYVAALRAAADAEEARLKALAEAERLEAEADYALEQLDQAESTLDSYRALLSPECCLDVTQVAKGLGIPNFGRNKLFDYLRSKKFVQQKPSTIPYQQRIDDEQAVVETVSIYINGEDVAKQKTKVTFRGLEYIINSLTRDGYNVNTTAKAIWDFYNVS